MFRFVAIIAFLSILTTSASLKFRPRKPTTHEKQSCLLLKSGDAALTADKLRLLLDLGDLADMMNGAGTGRQLAAGQEVIPGEASIPVLPHEATRLVVKDHVVAIVTGDRSNAMIDHVQ